MTAYGLQTVRALQVVVTVCMLIAVPGCKKGESAPDPVGESLDHLEAVLAIIEDQGTSPEAMVVSLEAAAADRAGDVAATVRQLEMLQKRDIARLEEPYADALFEVLHRLVAAHKQNLWRLRQDPALLVRYRMALSRLAPPLGGAS